MKVDASLNQSLTEQSPLVNLAEVLELEKAHIVARRKANGRPENLEEDSLAVALSGGGIRSATICLGIVDALNRQEILANVDYLSTVSGGGYLGGYLHAAMNGEKPLKHKELLQQEDIAHLRTFREYLYLSSKKGIIRIISKINLLSVAFASLILSLAWIWVPALFLGYVYQSEEVTNWTLPIVIALLLALLLGTLLGPNLTSPHRYYKRRLSSAYLFRNRAIRLKDLANPRAPYPLINATVNVNYDTYDQKDISYRGAIKSNYFLFSSQFCGSQVTGYVATDSPNYKDMTLATAIATSAAAVNSFMGNQQLPFMIRHILVLLNLRTGILAPNPQLRSRMPSFWPYYTYLELMGKPETTTYKIQISDGGHIENLAIYELLRRKVKVIIAVDAGEDAGFEFSDLRNLVIRANSELGINIHFHPNAEPQEVIRPNAANGFSKKQFVVARISSMEGAYSEPYDGLLIYIKSSVLENENFELRKRKREIRQESQIQAAAGNTSQLEKKRRLLDAIMYRTYNPAFPHESTADQFFDEAQWDAYHLLGKEIGKRICQELQLDRGADGKSIFQKGLSYFDTYD